MSVLRCTILLLAACTPTGRAADAGVDGGPPAVVCATPACAAAPCAPGCAFAPLVDVDAGCRDGDVPIPGSDVVVCGE